MNKLIKQSRTLIAMLRQGSLALAFLATWFGVAAAAAAAPSIEESPEYAIKAAFLFKFGSFVEWSATAFETASAPLVIGIVGADPFGATLDQLIKGHTIEGRNIVVKRGQRIEQIHGEHILFISQSEKQRLESILANLKGREVLTVAEFADPNIVIQFVVENDKVRFDVNLDHAHHIGIKLSSKLLTVARTVNPK